MAWHRKAAACLAGCAFLFAAGGMPAVATSEERLILQLDLDDRTLCEDMTIYRQGGEVRIPLGELSRQLGLGLQVRPEAGAVEGFIVTEQERFRLDVRSGRVTIKDVTSPFDPSKATVDGDDVYIDRALLCRWLPLDLVADLFASRLTVRPRLMLPLQQRFLREQQKLLAQAQLASDPGYPRVEAPMLPWSVPSLSPAFALSLKPGEHGLPAPSGQYTLGASGDLLYMNASAYLTGGDLSTAPSALWRLRRGDPEGHLLGPLAARELVVGDVAAPELSLVANSSGGNGLMVSNFPLTQQSGGDRHSFRGLLPAGWDVELYRNDALLDYRPSGDGGQYAFDEIPLQVGLNEFALVFYGPNGQRREERHRFNVDSSLVPAGAGYYRLASALQNDGQVRTQFQYDWGLQKQVSMSLGLASLSTTGDRTYAQVGLRGYWGGFILHGDAAVDPQGGTAVEAGGQTRLGTVNVDVRHARSSRFQSEIFGTGLDPVAARSTARLDNVLPAMGWFPSTSAGLELQQDAYASGKASGRLSQRIGSTIHGLQFGHLANWSLGGPNPDPGPTFSGGVLQVGMHRGIGLRGEVQYLPDALTGLTVAVDGKLWADNNFSLGTTYSPPTRTFSQSVAANRQYGPYVMGVTLNGSSQGDFYAGMTMSMGLAFDPLQNRWSVSAATSGGSGMATARVYLDTNDNGRLDAGESPLEGVGVQYGGATVRTGADGIATLANLTGFQPLDVTLDRGSLEDPLYVPAQKGFRIVPQPGKSIAIEFPVRSTGQIEGTVYLLRSGKREEVSSVKLELVAEGGQVLQSGTSSFDGFFSFVAVPSGSYRLRVAAEQLERLGLVMAPSKVLVVPREGGYIEGIELFVEPRDDQPQVPDASPAGSGTSKQVPIR